MCSSVVKKGNSGSTPMRNISFLIPISEGSAKLEIRISAYKQRTEPNETVAAEHSSVSNARVIR